MYIGKSSILVLLFAFISQLGLTQELLDSPDKNLTVLVNMTGGINFSVQLHGETMIEQASIDLLYDGSSVVPNKKPTLIKKQVKATNVPVVSLKNEIIKNQYNNYEFRFSNKVSIEFKVYNEGFAYRYITKYRKEVKVNETLELIFGKNYKSWASLQETFQSSYQEKYTKMEISKFPDTLKTYLPFLLGSSSGKKVMLTEADLYDYPHMFLEKGCEPDQLVATFPGFPLETEFYGDRRSRIKEEASYIALTSGDRSYPWRVFITTSKDKQLIESEIVYNLSREATSQQDHSWIKPGRVAWDWWNASNLHGVDFKTGLNTDTWKYYIDFAAENGLEYVILDEGWSYSTTDLTRSNSDTDLGYLIDYGNSRGVGIILWTTWRALNDNWSILDEFVKWGVSGIKVDFMDRADQWMVNFYEKAAKETYVRKLLIDFHGAFKPTGLRKVYPNILSYEGVGGLEESKWSNQNTPESNLELPFIRMACGPMDYTPGAMRNYHSDEFKWNFNRPSSQGTRAHQVALFVMYESGLQMFADSPSNYNKEKETLRFLRQIPNTWDETKVFYAKVGQYLVLARKKGKTWYMAGLTDGVEREFSLDLSFLEDDFYVAQIMEDGINSNTFAEDYKITHQKVSRNDRLKIKMNKEGGFVAIFKK